MSNRAIDLVAAADAMPAEYEKLKRLIYRLRDSHSIRTDLSLACDFVVTMKAIGNSAEVDASGGHAENSFLALFYSALLLYVRATKTQNDNRRSFDFRGDYDPAERAEHDILCDLRDKSLAHYGDGGRYNGPAFQIDGVFIPDGRGDGERVMTISKRLVISPELLGSLGRMTHRAMMLADKRTQEQNTRVVDAIIEPGPDRSERLAYLRRHDIAFDEWIGSADAAANILSGPREGQRKGTVRHG